MFDKHRKAINDQRLAQSSDTEAYCETDSGHATLTLETPVHNNSGLNRHSQPRRSHCLLALMMLAILQTGCLAMAVDTAVDTTIAVAKVPFKVVGAAVDVATPDEDDEEDQ